MTTGSTPSPGPPRGTGSTETGATTTPDAAGDLVTSWLRTTVPTLWGAATTAGLAALAPHLPAGLAGPLDAWWSDDSTALVVTVAAVAGWHAVWRRVERRVPAWVARVVLGSARRPTYRGDHDTAPDGRPSTADQGLGQRAELP